MYLSNKIALVLTTACLFLVSFAPLKAENNGELPNYSVKFHTGSFESAKAKAQTEQKLFFVQFYADWCTPCKWMDKTTFKDETVVEMMNDGFVALKMNIETNEGTDLKEQYAVRMLPTVLIFNSEGKMVDRVEKTLSSEAMISLLSFHKTSIVNPINESNYNLNPTATKTEIENEKLYAQYVSRERARTSYKLQIANYTDYTEAFKRVRELKSLFMEPIVVINDYVDNMTHYKVMMGEFQTMEEAEGFRLILKRDFEIQSIIR